MLAGYFLKPHLLARVCDSCQLLHSFKFVSWTSLGYLVNFTLAQVTNLRQ